MARFLVCFIFIVFFIPVFLKADDRGFRFTPSFTSMAGLVDKKLTLKTALQGELTYVIFNQLEFGLGTGFQRQHIRQSDDVDFNTGGNIPETFIIPRAKANSLLYYGVLRYNFDFFEDGYVVAAVKYGSYFLTRKDRLQKGFLPSTAEEGTQAPILRYENEFTNMRFFAVTLGYDLSNTVISIEYRRTSFDQNLSYINETSHQIVSNPYKKANNYVGINMSYKIDLF